jgi:hypothetical protein
MKNLFNIFMVVLLATIMTGCGSCEKMYDKANYESLTNEPGELTLWSGGKVMAHFSNVEIVYSASDSDALYFVDIKGSDITRVSNDGVLHKIEGKGETWYSSPGVLLRLED